MAHDRADRADSEVARNGGCATDGAPVMDFKGGAGAVGELLHPNWLSLPERVSSHRLNMGGLGMRFFIAITLGLLATSANAQNCQFYGNQTHCDNGLSAQRYGNSTYWNDGTSSQSYGNSTYNSDGTSSQRYGNSTYNSDSTSSQTYGNSTYFSDGRSCQRFGNQIHCN
jgi:hypothetical protein